MTYPPYITDPVARLAYQCGLRPISNKIVEGRAATSWGVMSRLTVKDSAKTVGWEGRTIKPTIEGVRGALRSLMRLHGRAMGIAILHRYGATSANDLGKQWYGTVYDSALRYIRDNAR